MLARLLIFVFSLHFSCSDAGPTTPPPIVDTPPVDTPPPTEDTPPDTPVPLFEDVTATHLAIGATQGFSMDARPADLDNDGDLDVVLAIEFGTNLLLLNDGTGQFTLGNGRLPNTRRDSEDIGIADFDQDGDLDIVVVSEDDRVNELYLNDGAATFSDASGRIPVTGTSNAVLVHDINGDGAEDILIGNNGQNVILINDGTGHFEDATDERLPRSNDSTQDLELGDVDGDGDLDLLVGNEDANRLLLNDGTGVFTDASVQLPITEGRGEETREADFGDVDGDGDLDILFANINAFIANANPQNRLLLNDGTGQFEDVTETHLPTSTERSFDGDFIDLDGDGDLDILTSNAVRGGGTPARFSALQNDGTGRFTNATAALLPSTAQGSGFDAEAADFNGDGRLDLYLASRNRADRLLFGK